MPPSPRATFRAALPPGAAPAGAMTCLLLNTLSPTVSPATLVSTLCSYATFVMGPHSCADFHFCCFPLPCQEVPQMFFCPPHSLLCCYRDFPKLCSPSLACLLACLHSCTAGLRHNWSIFISVSKVLQFWCLLISIFAAYVFCPFLQLYIFAILTWVPCRLRSVCHQYDNSEVTFFLSSLPWINNKNVIQQAGIKIQHKILWYFGISARHALPLWLLSWASQKLRDSLCLNGESFLAAYYHSMSNRRNYSEFQCLQMNCNFSPGN